MHSVDVSFRYQPGEYARALRRIQARRLRVVRDVLAAALALALGAYFWASGGFSLWVALLCGSGALLLAVLIVGLFVMPPSTERTQPMLRDPYELSFAEEGIHFRTANIDSRLSWSLYSSWCEDPDFLYLFRGKRDVTVVPRRALASAEEDEALRQLVMRHIGPAAV